MANTKISALPSATTPMAGTEVLPVVQSGATRQVSVANLTAGRDVLAAKLGVGGATSASYTVAAYGPYYSSTGANFFAGTVGIGTTPAYKLDVVAGGGSALIARMGQSGVSNGFTIDSDGANLTYTIDSGNLKIGTAGKGIDFSANSNAPGMTSELLNWYEEGTWTPTVSFASGSVVLNSHVANYTRIGRQVNVTVRVNITTTGVGTSTLTIGGLPFTARTPNAYFFAAMTFNNYSSSINPDGTKYIADGSTNITWTDRTISLINATFFLDFTGSYIV